MWDGGLASGKLTSMDICINIHNIHIYIICNLQCIMYVYIYIGLHGQYDNGSFIIDDLPIAYSTRIFCIAFTGGYIYVCMAKYG